MDKFILPEGSSATLFGQNFNTTGILDFIMKHRQRATEKSADYYNIGSKLRLQVKNFCIGKCFKN